MIDESEITYWSQYITNLKKRDKIDQNLLLRVFKYFADQKIGLFSPSLEELKNQISDSMVDLIDKLSFSNRQYLLNLFKSNPIPNYSDYQVKIISGIDNTLSENKHTTTCRYRDQELVPGFQILLTMLSRNRTTITFISARPRFLTSDSMNNLIRKLNVRVSFLSGDLYPFIKLILGRLCRFQHEINCSYRLMAKTKINHFKKLVKIYPHCRFVFFGDDTEGDYIFAKYLIDNQPNSVAFIRRCHQIWIDPIYWSPRIIYHSSYYLVIYYLLIWDYLKLFDIPVVLLDHNLNYQASLYDKFQVEYDNYYLNKINQYYYYCY